MTASKQHNSASARRFLATAQVITEALPFMKRYAGMTVVVKYGGHAMGDRALAETFARDIVLLKQVGANPVVVHGGGPQIGRMLDRLRIQSTFVDGLRVTDGETVDIVEMVLAGAINKQIVTAIQNVGGTAVGISGKDGGLIKAKKLVHQRKTDSKIEEQIDLGFVGQPDQVDPTILDSFAETHIIPVIAPIGAGPDGETFNINADTAAGAIAAATHADRLLMLTDVEGVLDGDKELIPTLSVSEVDNLIQKGVISGGMIPKVETCAKAVKDGVRAAVILDGRIEHICLLELFTEHGAGTLIS